MSQINFKIRIKPYVWDRTNNPIPGVVIMRGKRITTFIPYDEINPITDQLIDLLKDHERNSK